MDDHSQYLISNKEFISQIIDDAHRGECFVPFIGSGLSSPSGIIMGQEFTRYLCYTFYLIIAERKRSSFSDDPSHSQRWSLERQGWPDYQSEANVKEAFTWIRDEFSKICARYGWDINYEQHPSIYGPVIKSLHPTSRAISDDLYDTMAKPPVPLILRGATFQDRPDRFRQILESWNHHVSTAHNEIVEDFEDYLLDHGMSYSEQIIEKGIRSLSDWKATLTFLSRIRVSADGSERIMMESPDNSIIDAFNTFITRGKKPNLGHKMLAQLSKPLRIRTLLTTNFDNLTETAFEELDQKLTVLAVSTKGDLPSENTVRAQDTLVKLHGESHDTRADLSLDEEPSDVDKRTFQAYLTRVHRELSSRPRNPKAKSDSRSDRLLVIGYSGGDHRCIQMIKHWLENGSHDPRIYWICYNDSDVKRVRALFRSEKFSGRVITTQTARPDLLLFELYQKLELTLPPGGTTYEFLHAAPPSRESASQLSNSSIEAARQLLSKEPNCNIINRIGKTNTRALATQALSKVIEQIILGGNCQLNEVDRRFLKAMRWVPKEPKQDKNTQPIKRDPWVIIAATAVAQATSIAFQNLSKNYGKKIFWFELEDHVDGTALLREFLRMLAVRCGAFMTNHVSMHPESLGPPRALGSPDDRQKFVEGLAGHLKSVLQSYRVDAETIVIFLYGRDSYGQCAGISPKPKPWSKDCFEQLHALIEAFAKTGIHVIYFPLTSEHARQRRIRIQELTKAISRQVNTLIGSVNTPTSDDGDTSDVENGKADPILYEFIDEVYKRNRAIDEREIASLGTLTSFTNDTVLKLFDGNFLTKSGGRSSGGDYHSEERMKLEFLYALTLFRVSRYPTALYTEGVLPCPFKFNGLGIDNDRIRADETQLLVQQLISMEVFYEKPGGLLWFHGDVRRALQSGLENANSKPNVPSLSNKKSLISGRSRIHFWIADWYSKAFLSSGHIAPFIESIYHLCSSAYYANCANFRHQTSSRKDKDDLRYYRIHAFETALLQATRNIMVAWNKIEFWQASSQKVAWLEGTENLKVALSESLRLLGESKTNLAPATHALDVFIKTLDSLSEAIVLAGRSGGRKNTYVTNLHHWRGRKTKKSNPEEEYADLSVEHDWKILGNESNKEFESEIRKHFGKLGSEFVAIPECIDEYVFGDSSVSKLGLVKGKVRRQIGSSEQYQKLVWLITEIAYLHLRRGKANYHAKKVINWSDWLKCSLYCDLGIDFCKHVAEDAYHFELTYKAKLQGLYGIALANLGRFDEANRHLIDAQSLVRASGTTTRLDHAIIKCRMAELKLTQCFWMKRILESKSISYKYGSNVNANSKLPIGLGLVEFLPEPSRFNKGRQVPNTYSLDKFIIRQKIDFSLNDSRKESKYFHPFRDPVWKLRSVGVNSLKVKNLNAPFLPASFEELLHSKMPHLICPGAAELDQINCSKWHNDYLNELRIQFRSNLDDAVILLENAEALMQGVTHNTHWWFQVRLMQLRIYGYLEYIEDDAGQCIVFRRTGAREGIVKAFHDAWRIAGEDTFRLMRSLRYLHDAQMWYGDSELVDLRPYLQHIERNIACQNLSNNNLLRQMWNQMKGK